jgi:hypothetical protein
MNPAPGSYQNSHLIDFAEVMLQEAPLNKIEINNGNYDTICSRIRGRRSLSAHPSFLKPK